MTTLTMPRPYLLPSCRQPCVSANLAEQIALALTMSTKVDGAWLNMNIHKVIDYFTLDVILDTVNKEALAHIDHFNERMVSAIKKMLETPGITLLQHNISISICFIDYYFHLETMNFICSQMICILYTGSTGNLLGAIGQCSNCYYSEG